MAERLINQIRCLNNMKLVAELDPEHELNRILALSEYNLDYDTLSKNFEDLTLLAARFTGTEISLINLLDNYTQWTVAQHGIALDHMPREESVCQYTIAEEVEFEVPDLTADIRFKHLDYVAGGVKLKYYYGVPITTTNGHNLGALCVLRYTHHELEPEKKALLRIMAREVVNRLNTFKQAEVLKQTIKQLTDTKRMLAHDIRGPLSGIVGLSQLGYEEAKAGDTTELTSYMKLINESGTSAINLLEDILNAELDAAQQQAGNSYTLHTLKDKLVDLFTLRALKKSISFAINISLDTASSSFAKGQLLQIIGNLISNAIKFTPVGRQVTVNLNLEILPLPKLYIQVTDSGVGMETAQVTALLEGLGHSTTGTDGETGYGIGLTLVKQIIDKMAGTMAIDSVKDTGTTFHVVLPL
jgi:signal transduction histidine kinase